MCSDLSFLLRIFFKESGREYSLSLLIYSQFHFVFLCHFNT